MGEQKGAKFQAAILEEDYPHSNMMVQEELENGSCSEPRTFQKGDVQHMIFHEGDGPPFYSPYLDSTHYVNKPKGIRQVSWETFEGDSPPFYSPNLDSTHYVNKPNGIRQVIWERDLLKPHDV